MALKKSAKAWKEGLTGGTAQKSALPRQGRGKYWPTITGAKKKKKKGPRVEGGIDREWTKKSHQIPWDPQDHNWRERKRLASAARSMRWKR